MHNNPFFLYVLLKFFKKIYAYFSIYIYSTKTLWALHTLLFVWCIETITNTVSDKRCYNIFIISLKTNLIFFL